MNEQSGRRIRFGSASNSAKQRYVSPEAFALVFAALGERDSAFVWLDRAYSERAWTLTYMRSEPTFDGLHADPRWDALVRKMRFP